jgi:precorrin-3B C17-methyltransferase
VRIIGLGPGNREHLTSKALEAIRNSEVVVGYTLYLSMIEDLVEGKEVVSSGMRKEIDRAQAGIERARRGRSVCVVSSGDPGIYGMAGLVLQLLTDEDLHALTVEVIPGVTAAGMGAALLGAPLMHDFCVVSLSDLLTDLELILKRIEYACLGDFVLVLYNPKGKKRIQPLRKTHATLVQHRKPDTPVGIVRDAGRDGEWVRIATVGTLLEHELEIDMKTTIIVGNSQTKRRGDLLVTPRGYHIEDARHSPREPARLEGNSAEESG